MAVAEYAARGEDEEEFMSKLAGKVALISGSGRGIGRALALKLAAEGAVIVVNDLDEDPAAEVVQMIRAAGGDAVACVGDVTAPDFAERFVQSALTEFNGLDIIVNNAGYTRDGVLQKQTDEQFQSMLDVHVVAPFRILRAAAEPIRMFSKREAADGQEVFRKIVNISSIAGTNGSAGQINYSAAKSALVGMTKTMSKEWGRYKVCVNCVAFGLIETRLTKSLDDPSSRITIRGEQIQTGVSQESLNAIGSMVPLGRAGTAEEAAGGIYLLCIPESNYVSGQVLLVGGGISF
ncbi:MAG TPA: SDR family NAD(P)-dependent oxidoreductase [Steroidobacter sp.]